MTKHEIHGVVKLAKSEESDCTCCDGPHVYSTCFYLDAYPSAFPRHFGRDLDLWLKSMFFFKELEGQRIKITAELITDEDDE